MAQEGSTLYDSVSVTALIETFNETKKRSAKIHSFLYVIITLTTWLTAGAGAALITTIFGNGNCPQLYQIIIFSISVLQSSINFFGLEKKKKSYADQIILYNKIIEQLERTLYEFKNNEYNVTDLENIRGYIDFVKKIAQDLSLGELLDIDEAMKTQETLRNRSSILSALIGK